MILLLECGFVKGDKLANLIPHVVPDHPPLSELKGIVNGHFYTQQLNNRNYIQRQQQQNVYRILWFLQRGKTVTELSIQIILASMLKKMTVLCTRLLLENRHPVGFIYSSS